MVLHYYSDDCKCKICAEIRIEQLLDRDMIKERLLAPFSAYVLSEIQRIKILHNGGCL